MSASRFLTTHHAVVAATAICRRSTRGLAFHARSTSLSGCLFLPFTRLVESLMKQLVPDEKPEADQLASSALSRSGVAGTPSMALSNATLETVRMSEVLDRMFETALRAAH